jgi:hypothetical protein
MTGCKARRAQAAASSEVVVIKSMSTADQPKELICQGSPSEFEPCIPAGDCHDFDSHAQENGSGMADSPGLPPTRRQRQHDHAEREHRQSHEFEYQSVHRSIPPTIFDKVGRSALTFC